MPVINFSSVIRTVHGAPILDVETKKPVMLTDIALTALNMVFPDERLDVKAKLHRYKMALGIVDGGEIDIPIEQVNELKELIARVPFFSPLIVGRAYEILEEKDGQSL